MVGTLEPHRAIRGVFLVAGQIQLDIDAERVSLTENSDLYLATIFELKNWTLGEEFFAQFPQWRHLTRVRKP